MRIMKSFQENYKFGKFIVDDLEFPKVLIGSSPFIGAGQFGLKSIAYYKKFYLNPKNITKLLIEAINKGCNAIQAIVCPPVVSAIVEASSISKVEMFVCATIELKKLVYELKAIKKLNAKCVLIHGSTSDRKVNELNDAFKKIKDYIPKTIFGVATHNPGSMINEFMLIPDVKIILSPINSNGEFMNPSAQRTLLSIENARKKGIKVIGMKTLAAGKIHPKNAFEYISNKVDGVAIGIASLKEMEETLKFAENYFKT